MSAITIALVALVGLILVGWFCTSMWAMKKTTSCPASKPKAGSACEAGLHKQKASMMEGDWEPMAPVAPMAGGPIPAWGGDNGRSVRDVFGSSPARPMLSGTSGGGLGAFEFGDGLGPELPQDFDSTPYMAKGGMKYGMGPMMGDGLPSRRAPGVVGKSMSLAEMAGKRGSAKFIEKTRQYHQSREGEKIGRGKGIQDTGMRALVDGLRGYTRPAPKSRIAHADRVFRVQEGQHRAEVGPAERQWIGVPAAAGRGDGVPAPVAYESL